MVSIYFTGQSVSLLVISSPQYVGEREVGGQRVCLCERACVCGRACSGSASRYERTRRQNGEQKADHICNIVFKHGGRMVKRT